MYASEPTASRPRAKVHYLNVRMVLTEREAMNNMIRTNIRSTTPSWVMALLLSALVTGCGDGGRSPILGIGGVPPVLAPTVTAVTPLNAATGVSITSPGITATFDQAMAPITGGASFVVTCALPCTNPTGTVALDGTNTIATYTLTPLTTLQAATTYTATITAAASLATGLTLVTPYVWTFTTSATVSVLSTNPVTAAVGVCPRGGIDATFNVPSGAQMNPATFTATNFTVVGPGPGFVAIVASSIVLDGTGTIATAFRYADRHYNGIHGASTGCADRVQCKTVILQQLVQHSPAERAVRAATLQG